MDFKSVEQFIDLVTNPQKFTDTLEQLKAEQVRLADAIALVGKASEIEKIKEKAEKSLKAAEKKLTDAETQAQAIVDQANATHSKLMQEVTEKSKQADKSLQEATTALANAQALAVETASKERKLRQDQEEYNKAAAILTERLTEVDERLAKLRAAMG